ncbi:aldehyde dehydrogenase family protein [Agromyces albus]|uniref:Aldehyde dehydrogenase family protein n=1 Tax=Agromyces albus TaxID=205332 RepID=A0A4Q2L2K5_9MICO|nr:aldehyde dehydrogenase family protein [Agromyces albus]RXZ70281.1 aldehyde dehydrogenase family protein [Agromyces albus]
MSDTLAAAPHAHDLVVRDKFTGDEIATVSQLTVEQALDAIADAQRATVTAAALPRHKRAAILEGAAALLKERSESVADLIVTEAGKTIRQARKEVCRAINTLRLSAAEALRNAGEVIPFDSFPGGENRQGWYTREPLGLIVAITPYNDALNLVAHKIGPAIAGGNAVLLKPAQQTPLTAQLLVDLLVEAGLPEEVITVVRGNRYVAQALVQAWNVRMVSFTGGFATGRAIAATAGIKKLAMELGGNAPVLVFEDADLDLAVKASVSGSFWAAGQNCIGAQRILVHRSVFLAFLKSFVAATEKLLTGDPRLEATDVGPMISAQAAEGARAKIQEAVAFGAALLTGGELKGSLLTPAVLTGVPRTCTLWEEEVFAPIVIVEPFDDEESAVIAANDGEYALQAGIFTNDLNRALRVAGAIDAGGVMINDSSDYRLDAMPFGGSKYGSMGREGVRFAYEEMTQTKVVAVAR